jgi:CRP-like cAMP-binding protein
MMNWQQSKKMKNLIQYIGNKIHVSPKLEEAILSSFQKTEVTKHEFLLHEHKFVRKLFFINEGTIRTFYHHEDREVTSWFYQENQFLTSWHGFYNQEISYESIEALENCSLYWIDYIKYNQLIDEYPKFERFARLLAEEQLAFIDSYSKGYMFMSAKEKYKLLLSHFPDIELRVKLGYIASFLGISQETLSRLRAAK